MGRCLEEGGRAWEGWHFVFVLKPQPLLSHSPLCLGVSSPRSAPSLPPPPLLPSALPLSSLLGHSFRPRIKTAANFRGALIAGRTPPSDSRSSVSFPYPAHPDLLDPTLQLLHLLALPVRFPLRLCTMDKLWWRAAWGLCLVPLSLAQIGECPPPGQRDW